MGQYSCSVSAWSVNSQGDMVKIAEYKSSPMTVRWDPKRKEFKCICNSFPKKVNLDFLFYEGINFYFTSCLHGTLLLLLQVIYL